MKIYVFLFAVITLIFSFNSNTFSQNEAEQMKNEQTRLKTYALKINVDDMKKALSFYVDKLGFEIESKNKESDQIFLRTNDRIKLILNKVKRLRNTTETDTRVGLTLQVNDLDEAVGKMKAAKVEFAETKPRKEGVGNAIYIQDPFGRKISLMHQTIVKVEPFDEPKIYNFGLYIPDMDIAREFYSKKLGFTERSERFLPKDMPLGHLDNSFGFMLHARPEVNSFKSGFPDKMPFYTIVFETADLQKAIGELRKNSVKIVEKKKTKNGRLEAVIFEDPFGNVSEIVEIKSEAG